VAESFDTFYATNFARLVVGLRAYTGDLAQAQDIAQEAFCRALVRWNRVAAYDDPVAWVRRVAWNLANSRWRRLRVAKRYLHARDDEHVPPPSPDRVAVDTALAQLNAVQRRVVILYYLADLSVTDIAAQEDIPAGTVRSHLHRARQVLAGHLSDADV
jgi:RNA polymerase sigma-70 factor (ECF subfamily)